LYNLRQLAKFDSASLFANCFIFNSLKLAYGVHCLATQSMLRVRRSSNGEVLFALSGRIDSEHVTELESLIRAEGSGLPIVIDLKDVTLAGEDGIIFLARCEAGSITLVNCPPYIRKWITKQNDPHS
jgi:anti-anti-sigma regulatory factor